MGFRIQQRTVEELKKAMQYFLPHYVTFDIDLDKKEEWEVDLLFGLWKYKFEWSNIKYDQPDLDILDT